MAPTAQQQQSKADRIKALAEKHGGITPEIVLSDARKKSSPLHSHFVWDDSVAAEKYRLVQAAELIRRIKVTYEYAPEKVVSVRAYHAISPAEADHESEQSGRAVYVTLATALESYHDQLMDQCRRDMAAFRQKYAALQQVAHIVEAMAQID
jgi:4-hydroxy-L-threonine phosphate dehydrogenase PdxA